GYNTGPLVFGGSGGSFGGALSGPSIAKRQDSGFHDGVSVPQPPGVVTAPTPAEPPTQAEARAAAQPVPVGPGDVVLSKTKRVDNPTGPGLWLREDNRGAPGSAERLAAERRLAAESRAAAKLAVPAGFVGVMVRGSNGVPTLDGVPVSAATLAWL